MQSTELIVTNVTLVDGAMWYKAEAVKKREKRQNKPYYEAYVKGVRRGKRKL